jgi:hypothetical protein
MTILDFKELREARRRAELDKWFASDERRLAEIQRVLDEWAPIFDQLLAQRKVRVRRPRCEAPACWDTITNLHPVPGRTSDHAPALVRLCARHLSGVRSGRLRVKADGADMLLWELCNSPNVVPRLQVKLRRRKC